MNSTNFSKHRLYSMDKMTDYLIARRDFLLSLDIDLTLSKDIDSFSDDLKSIKISKWYTSKRLATMDNNKFFELEVSKFPRTKKNIKEKSGLYAAKFTLILDLNDKGLEPFLFHIHEDNIILKTTLENRYHYSMIAKKLYGDRLRGFFITSYIYVLISPQNEEFLVTTDVNDPFAFKSFSGFRNNIFDTEGFGYTVHMNLATGSFINEYSVKNKVISDLQALGIDYSAYSFEDILKILEMVKI